MSGKPEIANFYNSFVGQENVFRFDVPMKTTLKRDKTKDYQMNLTYFLLHRFYEGKTYLSTADIVNVF